MPFFQGWLNPLLFLIILEINAGKDMNFLSTLAFCGRDFLIQNKEKALCFFHWTLRYNSITVLSSPGLRALVWDTHVKEKILAISVPPANIVMMTPTKPRKSCPPQSLTTCCSFNVAFRDYRRVLVYQEMENHSFYPCCKSGSVRFWLPSLMLRPVTIEPCMTLRPGFRSCGLVTLPAFTAIR